MIFILFLLIAINKIGKTIFYIILNIFNILFYICLYINKVGSFFCIFINTKTSYQYKYYI